MAHIKSFAVGNGDTYYIRHNTDNFTIIDCDLNDENADAIIAELKEQSADKSITRFISTHPDDDHFGGIERLDAEMPIRNFYVVKNEVIKDDETESFKHYCKLRDDTEKAFYIYKDCSRRWMNQSNDERKAAGISILWPDTSNQHFKDALADGEAGLSFNNMSAIIRYSMVGGASFLWLGDLETEFMDKITDDIDLTKTTVVFAAHHGRKSGKIPDAWLEKLDPQIIVIGEAASRHLHYYTGYKVITQNKAGDITFGLNGDKVHIYSSNPDYSHKALKDEQQSKFPGYVGSITVETEYTLEAAK
ncbi:ComEC/Rec2 family competence protein [Bradyrhizobium genosp. P]|uniref:ComEC/Rec2 family competence protein n=1 Tax=Bradyrhizobium genosp. P TaxID=83641 RepID=UPI003CF75868